MLTGGASTSRQYRLASRLAMMVPAAPAPRMTMRSMRATPASEVTRRASPHRDMAISRFLVRVLHADDEGTLAGERLLANRNGRFEMRHLRRLLAPVCVLVGAAAVPSATAAQDRSRSRSIATRPPSGVNGNSMLISTTQQPARPS